MTAMLRRVGLPLVLLGVAAVGAQTPATIVLDHARLIDGTGAPPRDDVRIVIDVSAVKGA